MKATTERDKVNESKPAAKKLWRAFYDEERELFDMFASNRSDIVVLDQIEGYEPEYKSVITADNKSVNYPPKNIRLIAQATGDSQKHIIHHLRNMQDLYRDACLAKTGEFNRFPYRFPAIIGAPETIHVSTYPAHRSRKVTDKPFRLATRATGKLNQAQLDVLFNEFIVGFELKGIDAWEKEGELFVDGAGLLKANNAKSIQVREESGLAYKLAIKYAQEDKLTRRSYGFLITDNQPDIIHCHQDNYHDRTIKSRAQMIEYEFLPNGMEMYVTLFK